MNKQVLIFLLPLLLLLPLPALAAPSAIDQVRATVNQVLEVLRNKGLDETARREQLRTLVRDRFDFALMSQWTLGTYWRQASPDQQRRFIDLYSDLLEASYLGKVESYTDEKVHFIGERIEDQRAEVETEIATAQANIPLNYRLSLEGTEWKVYDVVIEGVSLVRTYRGSFGEIARKDGIEGLLKQVAQKVEEQRQARAARKG
ncbi:ABC transporter substrate-binding protein [Desulfuromonas carbonis]|uniref:MlaC/ttg2D family ABC transporter substrate-binding protein n=1 Tax=Desulfuromonas sp. DDH964 TaxID=1823759 RepID=UPI00078DB7C3|nr:ABC transporter substrate-binding protein [Desulfuromonas sp. DDH964]AMV71443.1 organic solvent tolerance ABC transporter substrate-binding protein [Desulfuromonas sp. DDH964]